MSSDTWVEWSSIPITKEDWERICTRKREGRTSLYDVDCLMGEVLRLRQLLTEARRDLQDIAEITGSGDRDEAVCSYVHSKATHAFTRLEAERP